jgi:hypothetical protein
MIPIKKALRLVGAFLIGQYVVLQGQHGAQIQL